MDRHPFSHHDRSSVRVDEHSAANQPDASRVPTPWTLLLYLAAAAMLLRFYDLPLKPLHHDEGVNALILTALVDPPHTYRYQPENYHGPTLYYFAWLSEAAFGMTTVALRFVPAVFGLITVALVLALRRDLGAVGAPCAAGLIAVSPGAVYFSRYFIHEIPLVCFTLATVVAARHYAVAGRPAALFAASIAAALMFATKETWIISAVVMAGAALAAATVPDGSRPGWARPALDNALDRMRRAYDATSGRTIGLGLAAAGLFLLVGAMFYTSFFTHWRGAVDAFETLAIWTKTGTKAHTRPWHTYLLWLWQEEAPLLVLGACGAGAALWKRDNRFAVFLALWSIGIVCAYSVIPYKTPWLTLNMTLPLALSSGYACELTWQGIQAARRARLAILSWAAAVVALMTYQAVVVSFVRYDDDRYPYVYAHTSRDVFRLVEDVRAIEGVNPRASIAVTSRDHFPLSWYLRAFPVGYYGRVQVTGDPLVIGSEEQQGSLQSALGDRYVRVGAYTLRPGVRLILYARQDLRRPPPG